jgi:hypothetical protein
MNNQYDVPQLLHTHTHTYIYIYTYTLESVICAGSACVRAIVSRAVVIIIIIVVVVIIGAGRGLTEAQQRGGGREGGGKRREGSFDDYWLAGSLVDGIGHVRGQGRGISPRLRRAVPRVACGNGV